MGFVQITEDYGSYKSGDVYEVNDNRRARLVAAGVAYDNEGPATPASGWVKGRDAPVPVEKPAPKPRAEPKKKAKSKK
jgi:hypothetical protein